jgi:hypothetical protein
MKKRSSKGQRPAAAEIDDILPEYDFSQSSPNKYASRYAAGSVVIVLDPDVAASFPTSKKVNAALRSLVAVRKSNHKRSGSGL